jgi:gluconolactonase
MTLMQVEVQVDDVRMHGLIDQSAGLRVIASNFRFVEGPIWEPERKSLLFSDIIGDTLYRWSPAEGLYVVRQPSNMANGNTYDREGRLLTCEHATSRVVRTEADGTQTVVASHYDGKQLNSPNDIVVRSDGLIYFTDPLAGRTAAYGIEREPELAFQGVYRVNPDTGEVTLLVRDFKLPNGLCFSPDERQLFVNDTMRGHIRVFDVLADGTLINGRLWTRVQGNGGGVPDGMKCDRSGNLYCTGPDGIHIFAPDATPLGVIALPEAPANFTWGGEDGRTLFVTAQTSVYALQMQPAS